ncbi:MAG: caspase family protein [Nitrospira sp.]|nr:caspase family protein [Nitrospira sp.]MCP9463287.1 caspase family protein [Nitrospira sp.]
MALLIVVVGLWQCLCPPSGWAQAGKPEGLYYKSWAVVIGIEHYVVAPPVPGAVTDAKQVAEAFRRLGFDEVVEIYDKTATSRHLHQLLTDILPRKVGRMDRLVIFYTGHVGTAQDADGEERSYLVPIDAQIAHPGKAVTVGHLKEFTRRTASKHTVLLFDAPVFGWEVTPPAKLSLEGRAVPEEEMERRAVQVISAARKGESSMRVEGNSLFVQSLLAGLAGQADLDRNGWLLVSELGRYLVEQVEQASGGTQHPVSLRIDGDGDTVLIEGRKESLTGGHEANSP